MTARISWHAYVRHTEWPAWTALGWAFETDLGPPHCFYSALYVWRGEGDPVTPRDVVAHGEIAA